MTTFSTDTTEKKLCMPWVVLLALWVSVLVMVLASPAQATDYEGEACANHAFDAGTVVKICASIGFDNNDTLHAHGEAVHTRGPGPVWLRITAVRLYHVNPDRLLEMGETDAGWENVDADSSSCTYSPGAWLHATVFALVGVDAKLRGGSIHHWTIRSKDVTVGVVLEDTCS